MPSSIGVLRARSREEAEAFIYRKREELKTRLPEGDQSILDAFHEIEADERFLAKIRDIKERMMPVFRRLETLRVTLAKQFLKLILERGHLDVRESTPSATHFCGSSQISEEVRSLYLGNPSSTDYVRHFQFRILKELSVHFPAHLILISKRVNG